MRDTGSVPMLVPGLRTVCVDMLRAPRVAVIVETVDERFSVGDNDEDLATSLGLLITPVLSVSV
jgi:hypothetical protein